MCFYGNAPKAHHTVPGISCICNNWYALSFHLISNLSLSLPCSLSLSLLSLVLMKTPPIPHKQNTFFSLPSQVDVIHRRLHKDILHNPVVMINFCPDLKSISSDLRKVHGEFIFLIDRSGSMSGGKIKRVKVFQLGNIVSLLRTQLSHTITIYIVYILYIIFMVIAPYTGWKQTRKKHQDWSCNAGSFPLFTAGPHWFSCSLRSLMSLQWEG